MKNALFLFGGYYPKPSANGFCCEKIMKFLSSNGYRVECIVNKNIDTADYEEREKIRIHRIPNIVRERYRELFSEEKSHIKKRIYEFLLSLTNAYMQIMYTPLFPISSPVKLARYIKKGKEIIEKSEINLLVSVNMPYDAAIAGIYLKKKYPKIKSVAYFLDPFAGGGHSNKLLKPKAAYKKALKWEKRVVRYADIIIAQHEHKKHFEAEYPKEILKKVHYLGVPLLEDKLCGRKENSAEKTILYAGALSEKYRDPRYIIDVFRYVETAKLVMYVSNGTDWLIEYVKNTGNQNVEIRDGIPKNELEQEMKKADAFLNIGNSFEMYAPSKIIDYICYGKPIISTYRMEKDTCGYYMKKYPHGLYLNERNGDVLAVAKSIDNMWSGFSDEISYSMLEKEYFENTPEAFFETIC